jgi:hypothetical protein
MEANAASVQTGLPLCPTDTGVIDINHQSKMGIVLGCPVLKW